MASQASRQGVARPNREARSSPRRKGGCRLETDSTLISVVVGGFEAIAKDGPCAYDRHREDGESEHSQKNQENQLQYHATPLLPIQCSGGAAPSNTTQTGNEAYTISGVADT